MSSSVNLKIPSVLASPASEPVSLNEAKLWLRVDNSDEDSLIAELIATARESAEIYTRRSFISQTLQLTLDAFPYARTRIIGEGVFQLPKSAVEDGGDPIYLPRQPVQSVSSITCFLDSDASVTVAPSVYQLNASSGRIFLRDGQLWPTNLRSINAIQINYVAGYGTAASVPSSIKSAIKMHVMNMYEKRTVCEMPDECKSLLQAYRIMDGLAHYG